MNTATKQKASSLHKLLAIPKKKGECSVPHAVHGMFCLPTFYVLVLTSPQDAHTRLVLRMQVYPGLNTLE